MDTLRREEEDPFRIGSRAVVHLGLGEESAALDLLEKGPGWYTDWLLTAPWFDPVRNHPRFQKILERGGLGDETTTDQR